MAPGGPKLYRFKTPIGFKLNVLSANQALYNGRQDIPETHKTHQCGLEASALLWNTVNNADLKLHFID